MEALASVFTVAGGALVTGLFGIVLWWLQKADADRKENRKKNDERLARIETIATRLAEHDTAIDSLTEIARDLKNSSEGNGEGVKILMRYMLQRYHAEYMIQGYVTTHQRDEFLEAYTVYHGKGGNGTGEYWMQEVSRLPVRDDVVPKNPYLEMMKKGQA